MRLEELSDQTGNWMVTGNFEQQHCIYKNEDILVTHNIAALEIEAGKQFYSLF